MKIYIDQGHNHSGADTGSQGNGLKEQDITYQIGLKVGDRLKNRGLSVKYSRNSITDNVGSTLAQSINERCSMANSWGANYFVSIHCNAADDKSANGTETLIYAKGGKAEVLAKNVNVRLVSTGLTNRGVKVRTDLGVLKNTNMPAILVEVGFITNAKDADIMQNRQDDIADAIANGIFEFLGIETETEEYEMAQVTFIGSGKNIKATIDGKEINSDSLIEYNGKTVCLGIADFLRELGHTVDWKPE